MDPQTILAPRSSDFTKSSSSDLEYLLLAALTNVHEESYPCDIQQACAHLPSIAENFNQSKQPLPGEYQVKHLNKHSNMLPPLYSLFSTPHENQSLQLPAIPKHLTPINNDTHTHTTERSSPCHSPTLALPLPEQSEPFSSRSILPDAVLVKVGTSVDWGMQIDVSKISTINSAEEKQDG